MHLAKLVDGREVPVLTRRLFEVQFAHGQGLVGAYAVAVAEACIEQTVRFLLKRCGALKVLQRCRAVLQAHITHFSNELESCAF